MLQEVMKLIGIFNGLFFLFFVFRLTKKVKGFDFNHDMLCDFCRDKSTAGQWRNLFATCSFLQIVFILQVLLSSGVNAPIVVFLILSAPFAGLLGAFFTVKDFMIFHTILMGIAFISGCLGMIALGLVFLTTNPILGYLNIGLGAGLFLYFAIAWPRKRLLTARYEIIYAIGVLIFNLLNTSLL